MNSPIPGSRKIVGPAVTAGLDLRRGLLVCGIVSSLLHTAMLVFIPMLWADYSSASQTVSELSAIGAPTRPIWFPLGFAWALLYAAFGWGVWLSAGTSRALRVVGAMIIVQAILSLTWPPMHLRGTGFTLTDTLHIAWTAATGVLFLVAMGFGAAAFATPFRVYSIVTMAILIGSGAMTGRDGPRVAAGLPTPWVGVWERINMAAFLIWVVVLAGALLRRPAPAPRPEETL